MYISIIITMYILEYKIKLHVNCTLTNIECISQNKQQKVHVHELADWDMVTMVT